MGEIFAGLNGWVYERGGSGNVLALGAVADFGVQNCQYTTKVDAR